MSWRRRTRAVAWGALLMLACSIVLPSTSAAFPIKWWLYPAMGDPDLPNGGSQLIKVRGYELSLIQMPYFGLLVVPLFTSSIMERGTGR